MAALSNEQIVQALQRAGLDVASRDAEQDLECAQAVLAAAIPPGHAVVPLKPTPKMLSAPDWGRLVPASGGETERRWSQRAKDWQAMVGAAEVTEIPGAAEVQQHLVVLADLMTCCRSHEGSVRVMGNVRASDAVKALAWAVKALIAQDLLQPACWVDGAELRNIGMDGFEPTVSAEPVSEHDIPLYTAPHNSPGRA